MFTYCIEELQFRAKEHPNSPNGAIRVYNGDVYKSDTAVSEETKLALQKAVRVLEDIPAAQKDWRPGSDELPQQLELLMSKPTCVGLIENTG
jgi:hypothetical protein